jgi:hypothetical protein
MSGRSRSYTAIAAAAAALFAGQASAATAASDPLTVSVDRTLVSTKLGKKIVFHARIANRGAHTATGLIAHLNVLSLRNGTYVDPEDWSSHRTQYMRPIPARSAVTTTWRVEAVNDGSFGVYVAVLPASGVARPPTTSPTVHLLVAQKKTLNSGGIVPLALGIPGLLGGLALGVRFRHRARAGGGAPR